MDDKRIIKNPYLLDLINKMRKLPSEENQSLFYKELRQTTFLLPAIIIEENKIKIVKITDSNGNEYLPAFTDWDNLFGLLEAKDIQLVTFTIENYINILKEDSTLYGMVINPYSNNLVLKKENLDFLEINKNVIEKGSQISIGIPVNYPSLLVDSLKEYFRTINKVNRAYLLQMVKEYNQKSLLLVLDIESDEELIFDKVGKYSERFLEENEILDMISLNNELGQEAIKEQKPFYTK